MFKKLFQAWTSGDLLKSALEETNVMLSRAEKMYLAVTDNLLMKKPIPYDIYKSDRELNLTQMEIRRKIMEHLSVNPRQDVVASMVLASVVIFIERIGDYSKNIYELSLYYPEMCDEVACAQPLLDITKWVKDNFRATVEAFSEEDEGQARKVLDRHRMISDECEKNIQQLIREKPRESRGAIVSVLYYRYLKRTSAHLMNIASSVLNPIDRIGFYPKEEWAKKGMDDE